jgi:hypothetical protein
MELQLDAGYPGTDLLRQVFVAEWVQVVNLTDDKLAQVLMLELDKGEAAAIALALEQSHSQIQAAKPAGFNQLLRFFQQFGRYFGL